MIKEIVIKDVFHLSHVFYNAWMDVTPIKLLIKKEHKATLDELFEEAEEKEMETDHIDWEISE